MKTIDSSRNRSNDAHQPAAARLLWDRKHAAEQLSISVRTLDYLIAGRKLNTQRIGKKVLIPHRELVKFAGANHYGSVAQ